jgi:hypothetical protein
MRLLCVASLCFVMADHAAGQCVVVRATDPKPSTQNARINVTLDGAPQKAARVLITDAKGKQQLVLTTDAQGDVHLPKLLPGGYCLAVSIAPGWHSDLCLAISADVQPTISSFSIELSGDKPPTLADQLKFAGPKLETKLHLKKFSGTLVDPVGVEIPNGSVIVYKASEIDKAPVEISHSAKNGRFSIVLEPGYYIAVFEASGFKREIVRFEITNFGSKDNFEQQLNIGSC